MTEHTRPSRRGRCHAAAVRGRFRQLRLGIARSAGLAGMCCVLLAKTLSPAAANVYASALAFSAPAVDATTTNTVDLSFRLNEPADNEVWVEVLRADTQAVTRQVNLGPRPAGLNTWTWDLKDQSGNQAPMNVEYRFRVRARSNGHATWTQLSSDTTRTAQFEYPRSIDVNRNPDSPSFGRVYVLQQRTLSTATGRPTQKGVYALNADLTDAFGRTGGGEDSAFTGAVSWADTNTSPFRLVVGPDDKLYIFDWSDTHGGVWNAPGDLSGSWAEILSPADIATADPSSNWTAGQPSPPAIHGRLSSGYVTGRGTQRTLYTVDQDLVVPGGNIARSRGSIWKYSLGPVDNTVRTPGQVFWNDEGPNVNVNLQSDLERDPAGNWLISQNRADGTDAPSLWRIAPDGNPAGGYMPDWQSLAAWDSPDPLRSNAGGIAVDPVHSRVASSTLLGWVNVFSTSLTRSSLQCVGAGARLWGAGDNGSLVYSAGATLADPAFALQTSPTVSTLNGLCKENSGNTSAGWAVGLGGVILRLSGCASWTAETAPGSAGLNAVCMVANQTDGAASDVWAVGDGGAIYKRLNSQWTVDADPGAITQRRLTGISRRVASYQNMDYDLYAVGEQGLILRRTSAADPASHWTSLNSGTTANLNGISMVPFSTSNVTTQGFAVGNNGVILRTTDGGASWTRVLPAPIGSHLRAVFAATGSEAWAVGDGGTIVHTSGGSAWERQAAGLTQENLRTVWFKDLQTGWAAGDHGVLLRTRNAGASWELLTSGTSETIRAIAGCSGPSGTPRDVAFDAVGNLYVGDNIGEVVRVYSPPDGENEYTTYSTGRFVPTQGDASVPSAPGVTAPATTVSTSQLTASWTQTGSLYRYAIGLTPQPPLYAEDLLHGWTETAQTNATVSGLLLQPDVTYYWYVQARSMNGVWGPTGTSAGTMLRSKVTLAQARQKAPGTAVAIGDVVVSRSSTDHFWVQEKDRATGMKVFSVAAPPVNMLADFAATVSKDAATGEVFLDATGQDLIQTGTFTAVPLAVGNRDVTNAPAANALLPDGLLVTVWGRVTAIDYYYPFSVYLDDGWNAVNDTPVNTVASQVPGIKINPFNDALPTEGDFIAATGVVTRQSSGGRILHIIEQ